MQKYVLGFAFSGSAEKVVLIKKKSPVEMFNRLNGVGGKVEPKETYKDAMCREFYEEALVKTEHNDWQKYAIMKSTKFIVHVYRAFGDKFLESKTNTEEEIIIANVDWNYIDLHGMTNLNWLIGAALDEKNNFTLTAIYR